MTEQQQRKKSRRRFLADLLFLGGGVTAAGLIAKTQFFDPNPVAAGEMVAPEATHNCEDPVLGNVKGEFVLPEESPVRTGETTPTKDPYPPSTGGEPTPPHLHSDNP